MNRGFRHAAITRSRALSHLIVTRGQLEFRWRNRIESWELIASLGVDVISDSEPEVGVLGLLAIATLSWLIAHDPRRSATTTRAPARVRGSRRPAFRASRRNKA